MMVMAHLRKHLGTARVRFAALLSLLCVLFSILPARPAFTADPPPDEIVGKVSVTLPPKEKKPPDDPEAAKRIESRAGGLLKEQLDWHAAYVRDPDGTLSTAAQATLALARDPGYGRSDAVRDLGNGGERVRPLIRNLDVGRHELLKHIYHRAMILANEKLTSAGLSPLNTLQAVNAGGTGDYTRDQDITVFAGDPVREKAFFDAVEIVARDELHLAVDVKPTGGIDFPQIEVTFFRGTNDLPDARFATDVEEFALKYQKAIANQAADREAYKGGGADIEVKGRRVPGKMYVQQLTWVDGRPVYVAETPRNFREGASMFSGTAPERWQRFERAAHIFSDLVQGSQHYEGAHHDLSKGPLKYAGRAIEHLCAIYGMKPWPELKPEDRTELLRRVWPQFDPKTQQGGRIFAQIADALDTAVHVKTKKELPGGLDAAQAGKADKIALSFLRNATGVTLSKMAQDMLNPPAFDSKAMRALAGDAWDRMSAVERFRFARTKDETFRAATGRASMENLLVAMSMLRATDVSGGRTLPDGPGGRMLARVISGANPELRPILTLAGEYAEVWVRRQQTSDPKIHAECDAAMSDIRGKLKRVCPLAPAEMPGAALLRKAARDGPRTVLEAESRPGRSWLSPEAAEVRNAFMEHLRAAFPSHAEEWKNFRATVEDMGMKGYVARRVLDEAFQWDTLADALTLVEMYQGGASWRDYGTFIGINLASRIHWGIGPLIQAVGARDEKAVKELGKNLVFMTLSRVVPWAASAKIAFDVMRGTVVVTVGWAVNQANVATIDALYTGEAGRTDAGAAGTARGRIRDSGRCVLPEKHVLRTTPPGERGFVIDIDRDAVYTDAIRRWTGADPDEIPRASPPRADAASFVTAHDAFVRILMRQAEQFGPTWVQEPGKQFFPLRLGEKEVEDALRALEPFIRNNAAREADVVLAEVAARGYRSYMEKEGTDVIREGLIRRYASDVLGGMIQHWHVRITAQILAARDIERAAVFQDFGLIARQLHEKYEPSPTRLPPLEMRFEGKRLRPVRTGGANRPSGMKAAGIIGRILTSVASAANIAVRPAEAAEPENPAADDDDPLSFRVSAAVSGVSVLNGDALDGSEPLRLSVLLEGEGDFGDDERPVAFDIATQRLRRVRSGDGSGGDVKDDRLKPGDVAEDRIVVRALASDGKGPELARAEVVVRVLLPGDDAAREVPLYRHVETRRDGSMKERYTYVKRFSGMPPEWKADGVEVYHGDYEVFSGDGSTRLELRPYRFGVLHGKLRFYNPKGQLVHEVPYENGVTHGDDIRFDPDSAGRLVMRYDNGWAAEKSATGTTGQPYVHITYEKMQLPDGSLAMKGEATRWWANGKLRWQGKYEGVWQDLNSLGGAHGEEIRGKTGTWTVWHENGQVAERGDYAKGFAEGVHVIYDEQGRVVSRGPYLRGLEQGRWEGYEYREKDTVRRWTVFENGRAVDSGIEE
jgi:antitoxin component YwqK of YwqJK toxin-antitoxin module